MDCSEDACDERPYLVNYQYLKENGIECPPDKTEIGECGWRYLHSLASNSPLTFCEESRKNYLRHIQSFARIYPCKYCAYHFRKLIKEQPPELNSRHSLVQWMCEMHNEVNKTLQKPIFDCSLENLYKKWPPLHENFN